MLKDLAGTAGLQSQLERTNDLLAQVLAELKKVNDPGLSRIVEELRADREG